MTTLNHLKKGESLFNKQLVIINSENRDHIDQNSSSFTYTFSQPVERVSKVDILYSKVPNTFFNINNDQATMSVTTTSFNETTTLELVVDDIEIKNNIIETTNIIDGSVYRVSPVISNTNTITDIYTKESYVYIAGTYQSIVDLYNFTNISADKVMTNTANTSIYVAKYNLQQELEYRLKISGNLNDIHPKLAVTNNNIFISALYNSFPISFYNANDVSVDTNNLLSNGQYTGLIANYNTLGDLQWRCRIIGINSNETPLYIVYDDISNVIYVTGVYRAKLICYDSSDVVNGFLDKPVTQSVFLAQYNITGSLNWVTKITGGDLCKPTDIIMNGVNVIVAINFNNIITTQDGENFSINTVELGIYNKNNLITPIIVEQADGIENILVITYDINGLYVNKTKIGGTNSDNNAKLELIDSQLIIVGSYTSNPIKFYQSNSMFNMSQFNLNGLSNIFIVKYNISSTFETTTIWSTKITSDSLTTAADVSVNNIGDIVICGFFNNKVQFYDMSNTYAINDILNTSNTNDVFLVNYDTNGNFKYRSYYKSANNISNVVVDAKSNYIYGSASYTSNMDIYGSNNVLTRTLVNANTQTSALISFTNNIANYNIDKTTLNKLVITKQLSGSDLNYTLNLNNFSQNIGFDVSKKFRATKFGIPIVWNNIIINNDNNTFVIDFIIANNNTFITYSKKFIITNSEYTPYNMAYEINKSINKTLNNDSNIILNQLFDAIIYDDSKNIFYIQFNINGNFRLLSSNLSTILNISSTLSTHAIISDKLVSDIKIAISNNSKLSMKVLDIANTSIVNNGTFNDAFPGAGNSLNLNIDYNGSLKATAKSTFDNINTSINDNISFESPWLEKIEFTNKRSVDLNWYSVAMSADGTKQTAVVRGGQIYISGDSGETWNTKASNRQWASVAISADGTIQTAVVSGGQIWVSNDSGETWNAKDSNRQWQSVAMSSDGTKQTAIVSGGQIYISGDSGETWNTKTIGAKDWQSVAMSADGTKQTAIVSGGQIWVSNNSGDTWNAKASNKPWTSVAISAIGTKQTAVAFGGQIWVSNDSGETWNAKDSNRQWYSVAMSADGTIQTAVVYNGQIWVSNDSGETWNTKASNKDWISVAMSADGATQTAVVLGGQIYISRDSGDIWNTKYSNANWYSVAMSADGTIQTAVVRGGQIWVSNNSGDTWNAKASNRQWQSVAMSADSTKQTAIVSGGDIWVSNDSGETWNAKDSNRQWQSVAMSADGTKQTAIVSGGQIYISGDSGETWNAKASNIKWYSVAMSADGTKQTAVVFEGQIWVSNNSGDTWNAKTIGDKDWYSVAMSADSTKQTAIVSGGDIWVSNDSGETWNAKASNRQWQSVAMSADGTKQTAVVRGGQIWVSNDSGDTWNTKYSNANWYSVAMSADGTKQTAVVFEGQIWVSNNSGDTWNAKDSNRQWTSVAMSADGTIRTAVVRGGQIWVSNDSGETWNAKASNRNWTSVAISSDGTKQTAVVYNGQIWVSNDSGDTWNTKTIGAKDWYSVSMSADGTIRTAVVRGGQIWVSNNSGDTWNAKDSNKPWTSVAISSDGTKQTAVAFGGQIYISGDSGELWSPKETSRNWQSVAMSADGTKQTAVVRGGQIWVSNNSGDTWNAKDSNRQWQSVAMSADGTKQTAVVFSGQIWVSNDSGKTWNTKTIGDKDWYSVAMSADGTKQTAVVRGGQIYSSRDSGETWKHVLLVPVSDIIRKWQSIAISADGSIQTAVVLGGQIYSSSNSGELWRPKETSRQWQSVAMSADGTKQTAVAFGGQIWVSITAGDTWNAKASNRQWRSVAISADGLIITAVAENDYIYKAVSTDNYTVWSQQNIIADWQSVAMSADGMFITATLILSDNIHISNNYGVTWAIVIAQHPDSIDVTFNNIALSSTGQYQTLTERYSYIYSSNDYGMSWSIGTLSKNWQSIAMSDNGSIRIAVADYIYVSIDYGVTWTQTSNKRSWKSVDMSSDGSIQAAVVLDGYIYEHPFEVNRIIDLSVKVVNIGSSIFDNIIFNETSVKDPSLINLNGFNMSNAINYNITSTYDPGLTDIYLPNGNYTPSSLIKKLNSLITDINPEFKEAFYYDDITNIITFTSIYSGKNVIEQTNLLKRMGLSELPSSITSGVAIIGINRVNIDFTGPLNLFIKSDSLGDLRKTSTPYSTNDKIKNIISPLAIQAPNDYFTVQTTVELFLNKKETISSVDIQIVDEEGNIINLNGSPIRINMYFYIS
jgi:photosystem II stability/assembly factor-like uncharacterized protein